MSAASKKSPELLDHLAWLGYTQIDSEGLVVSAPALVGSQVVIDRASLAELQDRFSAYVTTLRLDDRDTGESAAGIGELPRFFTDFLDWPMDCLVGWDAAHPLPLDLSVSLPEFGETLTPTYALAHAQPKVGESPWLLLVQAHPPSTDLTKPTAAGERGWGASPAKKFERLLRETGIPIGLLSNGVSFQLVYAPPKENSGTLTFKVASMTEIPGRLILGAFHLLLCSHSFFTAPTPQRLPALLQTSRSYQASVSEKLAEQVLHALYELLRGFVAAEQHAKTKRLHDLATRHPEDIYGGLVTVLLRLVFVLFAEDRALLPTKGLFVKYYSVRGLYERLRADAERHPDTMDHRYGAWAQLLALFRLIHGGCQHEEMPMPAREGHLFDFNRYPFLEGRAHRNDLVGELPLVSDGVIYGILDKLCVLEGERVSYRTLDVEEIGSVYQTIMGFGVETTAGTAVAIKGKRKNGGVPASPVISLESLLAIPSKDRTKWLKENADTELTGEADKHLKAAVAVDDLLAALEKRIDRNATPSPVAKGGLVLQPTDERRRSGSHYTPRSFTEPIVRKTLEPILKRFGEQPTSAQILELKICDIAVGSAAFLVETSRQLADVLVRAWRVHGGRPVLPQDETEELLAMRTIAQRCLYGVDRNPMAVDLAKLSLWLATLAKDHPFTFLDHSIRNGDSLVGLTQKQIAAFTWGPTAGLQRLLGQDRMEKRIAAATAYRRDILEAGDLLLPALKTQKLILADEALDEIRFVGDLAISAFFGAEKDKARRDLREDLLHRYTATAADIPGRIELKKAVATLRSGRFSIIPFHWEIEFPEVFNRENPGFDGIIGNPPFLRGRAISGDHSSSYLAYLLLAFPQAGGQSDLVAYFFRIAFLVLRQSGALGLIGTKTISQGDTRTAALGFICLNGGRIYSAIRQLKWSGQAAVTVSVVHIAKSPAAPTQSSLDGKYVERISSFLLKEGPDDGLKTLKLSSGIAFKGVETGGMAFVFSDNNHDAISLETMRDLLHRNDSSSEIIRPFIGGDEILSDPLHRHHRFVVDFGERTFDEARSFAAIFAIVGEKLRKPTDRADENKWWWFRRRRPELHHAISHLEMVLVRPYVAQFPSFVFLDTKLVVSAPHTVFASNSYALFCMVQSQAHEMFSSSFGLSLEDRPVYTPSDCFETFSLPAGFEANLALEAAGREYYEFRAALMQDLWLGLTEIYNHFHSPDNEALARLEALYQKRAATSDWRSVEAVPVDRSPLTFYATPAVALAGVQRLRALHAGMDAAVLTAYGWTDLLPKCTCEFLLDYEDEESESGAEESTGRKKKKPWRYRWPDEVRDEVLARLLKLNAERAEQERLAGEAATPKKPAKKAQGQKKKSKADDSSDFVFTPASIPQVEVAVSRDGWRDRAFGLPTGARHGELAADLYTRHWIYAALQLAPDGLPAEKLINALRLLLSKDGREAAALAGDTAGKKWVRSYRQNLALSHLLGSLLNRVRDGEVAVQSIDGEAYLRLTPQWRQTPSDWLYADAEVVLRAQEDAGLKLALLPFETPQPEITTCLNELLRSAV